MSIDFTVCETPYITQVYDDGHTTTITGSPVCNTYSMLVDFGWGGGPTSPAGGPDQNKVDISKLRERLAKALQSDTNCLTFLSIGGAAGALGVLDSVPIDVGNYGPAEQGDAFTSYGIQIWGDLRPQNPQIHINENGYFSKTGQTALIGGVGGTPVGTGTPAFQAIVMFHELGHATGALPRDGSHANQSLENDKTIMEKCKDAINNFVKNST